MESARGVTENEILNNVDRGLEFAVRNLGLEWEDEGKLTKREKYRLIAILDESHGEVPVTYSWFEYGASAIADKGFVDDPMHVPEERAGISRYDAEYFSRYFEEELDQLAIDEWWNRPILDFLERFYELHCPPELKSIYLANVELRKILENRVLDRIRKRGAGVPNEDAEDLVHVLVTIQTELASDDGEPVFDELTFRNLYDDFLSYSDVLEDCIVAAARMDELDPGGTELNAVANLKSVFDDTVWPMITCVVSYRTVRGPNPDEIRRTAEGKYWSIKSTYEAQLTNARLRCEHADLSTDIADLSTSDSDVADAVDDLFSTIDGTSDE